MKRLAILIEASDVAGQNRLPGAVKDVENWQRFLQKPLGGLWDASEIKVFNKPKKHDVESILRLNTDKYCFVIFSGHGEDGSVVLNESEQSVSYDSLTPYGAKGTLIIDACRGIPASDTDSESLVTNKQALANEAVARLSATEHLSHSKASSLRDIWLNDLKKRPSGRVVMLSCAEDEAADEDGEAGGYYTNLLIQGAGEWSADASQKDNNFSTLQAHDYAAHNLPAQQNPEYRPNRYTYFPFAVKNTEKLNGLLDQISLMKNGRAGTSPRGQIGLIGPAFAIPNPTHKFYG